jgi:hypothetical protein
VHQIVATAQSSAQVHLKGLPSIAMRIEKLEGLHVSELGWQIRLHLRLSSHQLRWHRLREKCGMMGIRGLLFEFVVSSL